MTSGMEDRHATDPTSKRREPLFVSNHHHLWLSRSHPPTPHLSRPVRPYGRPRRTPGPWGGGLPGWEAPPPWPSPTWMRRVIYYIYIENIFNSDYLQSKEKPA